VFQEGRIIARTRFLVQAGMLLGDPLDRARALFPEASFVDRDVPFELAVWEGVLQRINETTPFLRSLQPGTAVFRPYDFSEACVLAGELVVRVGIAPNAPTARIAAIRSAPGSVLQIRPEAVSRFFSNTSVGVLTDLGFEEDLPARLELFGLSSLDKVCTLTRRHLHVQFGEAGVDLHDLLHPSAESTRVPAFVPPSSIKETFDFDFATSDYLHLSALVDWMVGRAALRLGRSFCSRITLRLQPAGAAASRSAHRALKRADSDPGVIGRAANYLLRTLLETPIEVGAVYLTLSGLETPSLTQASLFFQRPPLSDAIGRLDERFPGAIRRAQLEHPDAPFPEDSIRFRPFSEHTHP